MSFCRPTRFDRVGRLWLVGRPPSAARGIHTRRPGLYSKRDTDRLRSTAARRPYPLVHAQYSRIAPPSICRLGGSVGLLSPALRVCREPHHAAPWKPACPPDRSGAASR